MSIVTDQKVKELEARVLQLEATLKALKVKLESFDTLSIPRTKRTLRDIKHGENAWVPQTTR